MKLDKKDKEISVEDCRMYENKYPNVNDLVMCKVTEVFDEGAYVELLEYNNIKGMILKSEITKNRKQSIKQVVREGKEEVLIAIRIDSVQGYIDLSKKDVKTDENKEFQEFYAKSKQVHNILKSLAIKLGITKLEELYIKFGWPLYKDFKHAYEGLKEILSNPNSVLDKYELTPELKAAIIELVSFKMTPHPVKIKGEVNLTCFTPGGIDDIKAALAEGLTVSSEIMPIKIKLIASPVYEIFTETVKKAEGLNNISEAIKRIEKAIKERGGNFVLNHKPEIMGEQNSKDIEEQLKDLKKHDDIEDDEDEEEDHEEGIKANVEGIDED